MAASGRFMTDLRQQLAYGLPRRQGLYDPAWEKDSCGVGFVCDIKGRASRRIVDTAEHMNCCMVHRGGLGYEANTGDGAGVLTALPHEFLAKVVKADLGVDLPPLGSYGAGIVFLSRDPSERARCKAVVEEEVVSAGQRLLGWRDVPTAAHAADIGKAARASMPAMEQLFIAAQGVQGDALGAQALPHSQSRDASSARRRDAPRTAAGVLRQLVGQGDRLQGDAHAASALSVLPGPAGRTTTNRIWRWFIRGFPPIRSRPGIGRSRTAS